METCPDGVFVFLMPPSIEALAERLRGRGEDTGEVIAARLQKAEDEIGHADRYGYVVLNEVFEESLMRLRSIVFAERSLRRRCYLPPAAEERA